MLRIFKVYDLSQSDDYESIHKHLIQHQKHGDNRRWDDYRLKIPPELLKTWNDIIIDCRRNGFINPYVWGDKMYWNQIIRVGLDNGDLCTLCERDCTRRDYVDSGEAKYRKLNDQEYSKQQTPCWKEETP